MFDHHWQRDPVQPFEEFMATRTLSLPDDVVTALRNYDEKLREGWSNEVMHSGPNAWTEHAGSKLGPRVHEVSDGVCCAAWS